MVSLQFEMNMLPMKWVAVKRSIEFWVQVMRMTDGKFHVFRFQADTLVFVLYNTMHLNMIIIIMYHNI